MSILPNSTVADSQDKEIDLTVVFHQLWANKWLILVVTSLALLMGIFYASRLVPQYQAELLLQIKSDTSSGFLAGKLSQQLNFGAAGSQLEATQIALIKSRFILAPVVKSLNLDVEAFPKQTRFQRWFDPTKARVRVIEFDVPRETIEKPFSLVFTSKTDWKLYDELGRLSLSGVVGQLVENKSIRLRINAKDIQPNTTFSLMKMHDASAVASLEGQLQILDLGANRQNTGVLKLTLRDTNPETAVLILNAIGKTIQIKDIEKNAIEASKTLEFLDHQLPITKTDLEKSESRLNQYRAKSGKIDIKLQTMHLLQQLTEVDRKLGALRISKIDKLLQYTLEHPLIIGLNTKIRELNVERNVLEKQLKKLPASDQIAVNLMRDVTVKNTLYMLLLNKIQELQVVKAGIVSDVRILALAKVPQDPLPTKRKMIYLASLMLGVLLSMAIIFVRRLLFTRVSDPHWGERHFDLVNLAIIPYSKEQQIHGGVLKNQSAKNVILLAHTNPRNLSIEALRSMRTTLQVRLSSTTNNIVSILGVSPSVGKTFVSANLAYLLAAAGKRVVLIDTDLRRGTLHKYFNAPAAPGLADILKNEKTLFESLLPTVQERLMILPRGAYPTDPSELLMSEHFKEIVHSLSQQFDIVVIDTPPVLLVTDAVLTGQLSGTNYLVLGANAHQPADIEMTIRRLTNAGVPLHGSIFNFHKALKTGEHGYGYGYGYYYDDKEQTPQ